MKDANETINLFEFTSGPPGAKVMLVGEAWGSNEAMAKRPFVGSSGFELDKMLAEAGLSRSQILCTNVISAQPPSNDFTHFLYDNKQAKALGIKDYHGIFPRDNLSRGISNLWALIDQVNPTLILSAGNWPLHILTPHSKVKTEKGFKVPSGITSWRGSQTLSRPSPAGRRYNLLPIIHPAAILREWGFRHLTVHDLSYRAGRFLSGSLPWSAPPTNSFWNPKFDDVERQLNLWHFIACDRELWLSVDLETYKKRYISVIGLADENVELCIPFFYFDSNQRLIDYFTLEQEQTICLRVKSLLEHPNVKIIGQNFSYDTQFFDRYYDIRAMVQFDTMVAYHLLFPGVPKGLHNIASILCNHYCYWKDESQDWDASEIAAESMWQYNCKDLRATYEIAQTLRETIKAEGLSEHYQFRLKEWELARAMTLRGITYDDKVRKEFQMELFNISNRLSQWLLSSVPTHLQYAPSGKPWYSSPQSVMDMLYNHIGINPILHKKTKRPTSDDNAINELLERRGLEWLRPLLTRLQDIRSVGVFRSHFLDIVLGTGGKLHSSFNITGTETFRWSSSETAFGEGTNLQNTPKVED